MTKEIIEKHIDLEKKFVIPQNFHITDYRQYKIVIAPDTAKWIVLENEKQVNFFLLLRDNTLGEALKKTNEIDKIDAQKVIIQIVARDFENSNVHSVAYNRLHFYLTNACNLHCPHCYMFSGTKTNNELSTKEIKDILLGYNKHGGISVTFSGGEICMRPDLLEIIEYSSEIGLSIELLTNGTLWKKEMIEKVAPLIERVQISIDGYDEEENKKIRGEGSFAKSLKCVDEFLKLGTKTEIAITPRFDNFLDSNVKKYVEFGQYMLKKYIGKPFAVHYNGELLDGRNIHLSKEQSLEYSCIVEDMLRLCSGSDYDDSFIKFHKERGIQDNCLFGNINISSTGDIYACPAITYLKPYANIRNVNFEYIWNLSNKIKKLSNVDNLLPCKNCELKYICGGECRYKHFQKLVNGDMDKMDAKDSPIRTCENSTKEYYYELMIRTNNRLFV